MVPLHRRDAIPRPRYMSATCGVEVAMIAVSGAGITCAVAYPISLRVISANRGVGATSTTGTTIDGIRSTCARISIAASRRCPGTGCAASRSGSRS
jgi:hypothetical protein